MVGQIYPHSGQGFCSHLLNPSKFRALVLCGNRILLHITGQSEMSSFDIHLAQYVYGLILKLSTR